MSPRSPSSKFREPYRKGFGGAFIVRRQLVEVEQLAVHQVGRGHVAEGVEDRVETPGMLLLPVAQQGLDLLALELLLRAAKVAGNDRELPQRGVSREVLLLHVGERADHDVPAVVGAQ